MFHGLGEGICCPLSLAYSAVSRVPESIGLTDPLSSEFGTSKTVKARLWHWLEPFFVRKTFALYVFSLQLGIGSVRRRSGVEAQIHHLWPGQTQPSFKLRVIKSKGNNHKNEEEEEGAAVNFGTTPRPVFFILSHSCLDLSDTRSQ